MMQPVPEDILPAGHPTGPLPVFWTPDHCFLCKYDDDDDDVDDNVDDDKDEVEEADPLTKLDEDDGDGREDDGGDDEDNVDDDEGGNDDDQ